MEDRLAPATGLVAAYNFDQGSGSVLTDLSGNGHNGTIVNATWSTAGKYGDALSFNGTSSLVTIPDATSLHLTSGMTLEAWVNPSVVNNNWRDVIYKGNDNFYLEATSSKGSTSALGGIVNGSYLESYGTSALKASTWAFLTGTYDGTTMRLYVNGTLVSSKAGPSGGSLLTSTNALQIGGDSFYGQYFQGLIDNVRVYNAALTATQIQTDMNTPVTAATPPATPTGLTATAGNAQVTLSWTASSGATSYNIYRSSSSGGEGSTPYMTGVTSTSFTDSGLGNGTIYYYEVSAVNSIGQSPVSGEVSATPQIPAPSAPTGLTATAGNAQVTLNWTASSGAASYNIYRAATSGGEGSTPYKTGVTGTSFIDSGLSNGTTYYYEVSAVNAGGQSPVSSEVSATPQTPPTAPTNVTATAGNAQVTLSWTAPSGATSYNIYRSTSSGGEGSTPYMTGVTSISFTDSGLSNGTAYYYQVSAVNAGGQSPLSSEVSATPQAPPTAPTNVIATAGNAQVTLSWTASSGATSYNIYRSTSSGGEGSTPYKTGVTTTSFTDSGLTNGTAYYYQVSAVNAGGQSPVSSEVSATPQGPPATPTGLTATAGNSQVTLNWTASSGATSYNIYRSTSSGSEGSTPYKTGVTGTSFIDSSLSNGTAYYYEVSAVNAGGQSPVSSEVSATPQAPPTAPTNVTATAGNAQVTLSWTASSGATSYNIYRSTTSGGEGSTPYMTGVSGTSFIDPGLSNGTTYYYEVGAVNVGGQSPVSSEVSATPQVPAPPAPTNVTATAGNAQVTLNWTASSGATSYDIYRATTKGGEGSTPYMTGVTTTSFTDTGLTNGTTYFYEVSAVNAGGQSPVSSEASATPQAGPAGLVAAYNFDEETGTTVHDLSGNGNNGTIVNATWSTAGKYGDALSFNGTNTLVNIPNAASLQLTTGMTLEAWVEPTAAPNGWQDVFCKGNVDYFLVSSSQPSNTPMTGGTAGSAVTTAAGTSPLPPNTWSFLAAIYNGTSFVLYVNGVQVASQAASGSLSTSTDLLQIGGNSFYGQYFQGLIDNARVYNIALSATQIQTDMNTPVSPTTPPPLPSGLTATAGNAQVTLNWSASSGATSYNIYRSTSSGGEGSTPYMTGVTTTTSFTDSGLTNGTTYYYEVSAVNAIGQSPVSSEVSATPQVAALPAPTGLTATAGNAQVTLSWTASTGATSYDIYRSTTIGGEGSTPYKTAVTTTSFTDSGLTNGTTYYYEVSAVNSIGQSPASSEVSVTPQAAAPSAPIWLTATAGNTQATLNWLASSGAASYDIYRSTTSGSEGSTPYKTGVTTTSFTDSSLSNGATYFYEVSAINSIGQSPVSYEVSATPLAAPTAPNKLTATAASPTQINLSWTASTSSVGVNNYNIYRQGPGSTTFTKIGSVSGTTTTFSDTALTPNTSYSYEVQAADVIGNRSPVSNVASATTPADTTAPTAPSNLTATTASATKINLSWAASTDNVSVTGYNIYRKNPGSNTFTQIATVNGLTTTYSDTGLTANSTYSYEVQATDAAGNLSSFSNVASATAQTIQPPTAPTNVTATAAAGTINLSWTASTSSVGIFAYLVEREDPGSTTFIQIASVSGTTYSDAGLASNSTYTYRVRAQDTNGSRSAYSSTASIITPSASVGLVAAYTFDEGTGTTVLDSSGNGNNGTIVNAAWSTSGKYGAALSFNGSSALVNIPNASSLQLTTGMTLEAWVNLTAAPNGWQDVLYKGNDNYWLESSSSPTNAPAAGATVGPNDTAAIGTSALPTNTWSFLTETFNGSNLILYVNGVQVASKALSGSLATSTDSLQIGGDSLYGQSFQGLIDNVRVYNMALTVSQIQTDMNTPVGSTTSTTTPTVLAVSPSNGATQVATGANITVSFNNPMNPATINTTTIQLLDPSGAVVPATVNYSGTTATLTPTGGMVATANYYTVRVTTGVQDMAGTPLASNFVWSFSTGTPTFQDTQVFSGLSQPTAVQFAPDGRVFVAEKSGLILVYSSLTAPTPTVFADLRSEVDNNGSSGLLDIALSPNFATTPYIYVLYTYNAPPGGTAPVSGRLSRLTVGPGSTWNGQETVLVSDWAQQYPDHSIGSMAFGSDGALYVSAGDGASPNFVDYGQTNSLLGSAALNDLHNEGGALRSQGMLNPVNPTNLDGSVIRIDPNTGLAMPFTPTLTIVGTPTVDANGVVSYSVVSSYLGSQPQTLRVLQPTHPAAGQPARFIYLLPVLAGLDATFGDGLQTAEQLDLQDQYNATLIAPSFPIDPWYGDNATDPTAQLESFMVKDLVPWVNQKLAAPGTTPESWLIGFSKSGFGALTLILRNPNVFSAAAAWDTPAQTTDVTSFSGDMLATYGTQANFANYEIPTLVSKDNAPFQTSNRIWISGDNALYTSQMVTLDQQMTSAGIQHTFVSGATRAHNWTSGWLPLAVQALAANTNANGMPRNNENAGRIIAYGFRDPLSVAVQPGTNQVWVSDVGANWQEIDRLSFSTSGVVQDFGWPAYDGPNQNPAYAAANLPLLQGLYAQGPSAVVSPYYAYPNGQPVVAGSGEPTGVSEISSIAFAPGGGNLPTAFNGALFFADTARNYIYVMYQGLNGQPNPSTLAVFDSTALNPTNLVFGPDGSLYYTDAKDGTIHRVQFVPPSPGGTAPPPTGLAAPAGNAAATTTNGSSAGTNASQPSNAMGLTTALPGASIAQAVLAPVLGLTRPQAESLAEALAAGLGLALSNGPRLDSNVASSLPLGVSALATYSQPIFLEPLARVRPVDPLSKATDSSQSDSAILDTLFASPDMLSDVWFGVDRK